MSFRQISVSVILLLAVGACTLGGRSEEGTHLKMGLLPIQDTLPFYVAEQQGYFEDEGISVELVPVKGAQERDALMQAGEIDGMLTDLIAVGLFNRDEVQVKVVCAWQRHSIGSGSDRGAGGHQSEHNHRVHH
jgi:NitT/TauT family transport system substrate-binding protein